MRWLRLRSPQRRNCRRQASSALSRRGLYPSRRRRGRRYQGKCWRDRAEHLHPVITPVGHVDVPETVHRYNRWVIKLAIAGALGAPLRQKPAIRRELLYPVIVSVSHVDVPGPIHQRSRLDHSTGGRRYPQSPTFGETQPAEPALPPKQPWAWV